MPENTLPLTNKHSTLSFELPKCIVQSTSGDDNGSDELEKDSDEGQCTYTVHKVGGSEYKIMAPYR